MYGMNKRWEIPEWIRQLIEKYEQKDLGVVKDIFLSACMVKLSYKIFSGILFS
jgi:hypothetical protein